MLLVALATGGSACMFSTRPYAGPRSDHFDGTRFVNDPEREMGIFSTLAWALDRDPGPWPEWVESTPGPPPPRRVDLGRLRVTFVGHATVLVQLDGRNILTDPVWSDRIGPTPDLGVARRRAPGLRFEDLPPVDLVLLSHNHYDHLDLPTLRRLMQGHRPAIAAGLATREFLRSEGIVGARDFDWWDEADFRGLKITSVPTRHFSMRGIFDSDTMLWSGWVVEGPSGARVYFPGDTGDGPHFAAVGRRLGPFRLALLPIGAYRPRWFMSQVHIGPFEAVAAHQALRAATSVAIHFGTFKQADDGFREPVVDLRRALREHGVSEREFLVLEEGRGRDIP